MEEELEHSDGDLLKRLLGGDSEAAAILYDRHHRPLYAYVRSLLKDEALSEDVVHETFLRLLEARPGRPVASVRSFLFAMARNRTLDLIRRSAVQESAQPRIAARAAAPVPDDPALGQAALAALGRLPLDQRETVSLKVFGRLTFAQIADVLSIPTGTAASRYRYALEKLAQELSVEGDDDA